MSKNFLPFNNFKRNTLYKLLLEAYSSNTELVNKYGQDWLKFDDFIFNNLNYTNNCGFITTIDKSPIGFISWNPENLPKSVEIGHNCIIKKYQNSGYGKEQLQQALNLIASLKPELVISQTGDITFFKPAQKMYTSIGFKMKDIAFNHQNIIVPRVLRYEYYFKKS